MCTSIIPPQMSGQMIAYAMSAVRVLIPSDKRVLLSSSSPLPPSPPAEKATARQDQAGKASTGKRHAQLRFHVKSPL
jgi:hypothetical protein